MRFQTVCYRVTLTGLAVITSSLLLWGCGGGGGGSLGGPTPGGVTQTITSAGGSMNVTQGKATYTFNFPPGAVSGPTQVTITPLDANSIPSFTKAAGLSRFTPNAGNQYVGAFKLAVGTAGFTQFAQPVSIGATGLSGFPAGTSLNLATFQSSGGSNGQWVDIGTFLVGTNGGLTQQPPSAALPGVTLPSTLLIYKPAPGTSTAYANYGVAILADEQGGKKGLQIVQFIQNNAYLTSPVVTNLPVANAYDLDGQALTPDGSQGVLVDGGNTVRFFSGVQLGNPTVSSNTLDISNYGGDGDSIAIMPNGDTAVVSGDSSSQLLVVSGIVSGNPVTAGTIPIPSNRDGVVISNDGKVLLARGGTGLTVFSIAPASGGGYTFTQTADLAALGAQGMEDGRDGMAISPVDSSRAVVIGNSNSQFTASLIVGLPNSPSVRSVHLNAPASMSLTSRRVVRPERHGSRLALSGVSALHAVAISPDGKLAVVGADVGLILLSGVDTGNLAQVGSIYSPSFTVGGQSYNLGSITTLGFTLDGKYVVVGAQQPSAQNGTVLLIPVSASGFGTPFAQVNGVSIPANDQILIH
ncbi:hypothetical protein CTKA_02612 [Chthonomonas calidirosea]|uniref:Uncharacterized protein n=1 Tax=Chthonomonas calidirosea (strain DSM 23976 / ICMP 18418 / T49) TaxID=1303518 RepID=S0EV71_CHTCT|nr:hypothetical protein [Chthonomonas calidirosea]CCW35303.1 hypothetical protein CCALI_01487 [Chthonomonas calidirosea T49]CEK20663.1 hypothetical protein CTKA_02612 [Chthonomonas calidirosea]